MKRPKIGEMNYRVAIQRPTRTDDGLGGGTETFTTLATVWASIDTRRAYAVAEGARETFRTEYVVRTRYLPDVQEGDVLLVNGRRLRITGVVRDQFAGLSELYAEER